MKISFFARGRVDGATSGKEKGAKHDIGREKVNQ